MKNRLVVMMVFGIRCNFFVDLPIRLKTCRSNIFLFFTRQNVRARKNGQFLLFFIQVKSIHISFLASFHFLKRWVLASKIFWICVPAYFDSKERAK